MMIVKMRIVLLLVIIHVLYVLCVLCVCDKLPPFLFVCGGKQHDERRVFGASLSKLKKSAISIPPKAHKKNSSREGRLKTTRGSHTHNRTKPCLLLLQTVILIRITRQTLLFSPFFPFECYFRRVQTLDRERYCTSSHRRMDCFIIPSERLKTKADE